MALAAFFEVTQEMVSQGLYPVECIGRRVYKDTNEMEPLVDYIKRKEAYDRATKLTIALYNKAAEKLLASDPDLNKPVVDEMEEYEEILQMGRDAS